MPFADPDTIRHNFSLAMSDMFRQEVPAYGTLLDLVGDINKSVLSNDPELERVLNDTDGIDRVSQERHGAIRLGSAKELQTVRRLFSIMGMYPVGYYDLSVAGIPVHSTGFRPTDAASLAKNPFRVFTSLIRLDLIREPGLRAAAEEILASRNIFSERCIELMKIAETDGGLSEEHSFEFVRHALDIFRWHANARVDKKTFDRLHSAHRLIADVVSFRGPHINHLTPRSLDIDQVQQLMPTRSITPKAVIEGPPARQCPILLRQTSFTALKEAVMFEGPIGDWVNGHHTARFGEIEQRGAALTPKGRALYDKLLARVREEIIPDSAGKNSDRYMQVLEQVFEAFPDRWSALKDQKLVYFHYYLTEKGNSEIGQHEGQSIDQLISRGLVAYAPIIYEDFLPVSAAGIFRSNLGAEQAECMPTSSNQSLFEEALGTKVSDAYSHYARMEARSLERCIGELAAKRGSLQ